MFCPKCGAENPDEAAFCKGCGYQLKSEAPATQPAPEAGAPPPAPPAVPPAQPAAPAAPTYAAPPAAVANTSGQGEGAAVPPEASGWTFAGFVPFGIFGFVHGLTLWAIIGLVGGVGSLIPIIWFIAWIAAIVYAIYIGINGKKLAWQFRKFDSVEQFVGTMKAWNMWGLILLIASVVLGILGSCMATCMMMAAGGGAMNGGPYF